MLHGFFYFDVERITDMDEREDIFENSDTEQVKDDAEPAEKPEPEMAGTV